MRAAALKETSFRSRLELGLKFEDRVREYMQSYGLEVHRYGLDTLPGSAKKILIRLDDPTSLLLRFSPDLYCPVPGRFSFFIECKSRNNNSPYYSYNLESYNAALELAALGVRILVVFSGFKADWVQNLKISKLFKDPDSVNYSNGSSKPFVLIHQAGLPSLLEILRGIKAGSPRVRKVSEIRKGSC